MFSIFYNVELMIVCVCIDQHNGQTTITPTNTTELVLEEQLLLNSTDSALNAENDTSHAGHIHGNGTEFKRPQFEKTIRGEQERKDLKAILKDYDYRMNPPREAGKPLVIYFNLQLKNVVALNTAEQKLWTTAFVSQTWTDRRLSWNPVFTHRKKIPVSYVQIWTPKVILLNKIDNDMPISHLSHTHHFWDKPRFSAMVDYKGKVVFSYPEVYITSCNLDLTSFPFDNQTCHLEFMLVDDLTNETELRIPTTNFDKYTIKLANNGWKLERFIGINLTKSEETDISDPTLRARFSHVNYIISLRRHVKVNFYYFYYPNILLNTITMLQFFLPTEMISKRMALASTLILIYFMFLFLMTKTLPISGQVPIIVLYEVGSILVVGSSMILTILFLKVHYYVDHGNYCQLSPLYRKVFLHWLARVVFVERFITDDPTYEKKLAKEVSYTSLVDDLADLQASAIYIDFKRSESMDLERETQEVEADSAGACVEQPTQALAFGHSVVEDVVVEEPREFGDGVPEGLPPSMLPQPTSLEPKMQCSSYHETKGPADYHSDSKATSLISRSSHEHMPSSSLVDDSFCQKSSKNKNISETQKNSLAASSPAMSNTQTPPQSNNENVGQTQNLSADTTMLHRKSSKPKHIVDDSAQKKHSADSPKVSNSQMAIGRRISFDYVTAINPALSSHGCHGKFDHLRHGSSQQVSHMTLASLSEYVPHSPTVTHTPSSLTMPVYANCHLEYLQVAELETLEDELMFSILQHLEDKAATVVEEERTRAVICEWEQLAFVLDRTFGYIYILLTVCIWVWTFIPQPQGITYMVVYDDYEET